jgi:N-methylhydantoinase A/oxoprolinase/acetone carboxylase beta subunit
LQISVGAGGAFTDVVIANENGITLLDKALTTPDRIINGMLTRGTRLSPRARIAS